jgi:transcriptional regulator with XRE-family HTH domain
MEKHGKQAVRETSALRASVLSTARNPTPELCEFPAMLRARRTLMGFTLQVLALHAGCAKSYISALENGTRPPPSDQFIHRLESVLKLPAGQLRRAAAWSGLPKDIRGEIEFALKNRARETSHIHNANAAQARAIPLIETSRSDAILAAARGIRRGRGVILAPGVHDQFALAIRVHGTSMSPAYLDGDILVLSPASAADAGRDCAACVRGRDDVFLGRAYHSTSVTYTRARKRTLTYIRLQPLNSDMPPLVVARRDVIALLPVVMMLRSVTHRT